MTKDIKNTTDVQNAQNPKKQKYPQKKPDSICIDSNILAKKLGYEKYLFNKTLEIISEHSRLTLFKSSNCYWISFRKFQELCESIPISDKQKYEIACYFIGLYNRHKIRKQIKKERQKSII